MEPRPEPNNNSLFNGAPSTGPANSSPKGPGREQGACVVLTGNPNCGKTTVFNALTGLRARVGNYAGVTVERKEGLLQNSHGDIPVTILDLPGAYSLSSQSLDEQIARDVLFGRISEVPIPALVVVVLDASNLQRNLYFTTQVIELGYPTLVALNMIDVAEQHGQSVNSAVLAEELGVPVIPLVASLGKGITELRCAILQAVCAGRRATVSKNFCELPPVFEQEVAALSEALSKGRCPCSPSAKAEALLLLGGRNTAGDVALLPEIDQAVKLSRSRLESAGIDWRKAAIEARYRRIAMIQQAATSESGGLHESSSDRLDRVITHKYWGMLIFLGVMAAMFLSIFLLARLPMELLQNGVNMLGDFVAGTMPAGDLRDLLVKGVIQGVGAVIVFLPQICLLFLFIGLLEDSGYMARAAFLMDRLMSKVGLHGKSFIPMLSSFACAIPGILATRTIENSKDRIATILIAPLMSCSARLPVYVLLLAACFPNRGVFAGLTMLCMYLLGVVAALGMAWVLKKSLLKGDPPMLVMELPS